ncbi:hypothetical protein D7Z54_17925 [Salibacterium salarium]|uniref:Helicase Helix-turn-helix domain-containing protein n=1 Tax=Salibacterium salarium TaxID=284579 RepID=A0A3R9Q2A5_9BACI|nr:helix-turn-helix domain-containing protein [Salibacterium salarium]RSL32074.1 hypothetical protein D7Z54_17925 [Salibacterium salarium]
MNNLSFRQTIFLYLLNQLDGERSVNSIFHILTGKKSSQTIQDIKWYNVTNYFHMFPYWKASAFKEETEDLSKKELIHIDEKLVGMLPEGKLYITNFASTYEWPVFFNGWKYGQAETPFWKRLALLVQCLSYSLAGSRSFVPVFEEEDIQQWLKQIWPKTIDDKRKMADVLFRELIQLLETLPDKDAFLFSYRLSGYRYTGLTLRQLSSMSVLEEDECYFRFQAVIHYLLEHMADTIYLKKAAEDLVERRVLTSTTKKTLHYLNQGFTIEDIANIRRLKRSTIEDHLVEIASEDSGFAIHQYVPETLQNVIIHTAKAEQTMRLKTIKEAIPDQEVDYYHIRLTLAYFGGNHGNT